jgi:ABC-2 type transport system permease protein
MMISLMGMLPVIILSGFIFPLSSMPLPLQVINIIPQNGSSSSLKLLC